MESNLSQVFFYMELYQRALWFFFFFICLSGCQGADDLVFPPKYVGQCLAICFPITNFYLSLLGLKAFSHPVFIFRQYLVPKHSSRVPAPVSLLALPRPSLLLHIPSGLTDHPRSLWLRALLPLSSHLRCSLSCPAHPFCSYSSPESQFISPLLQGGSLTLASLLLLEHSLCLIDAACWSACSPTDSASTLWVIWTGELLWAVLCLGGCQAACLVLPTGCWPHITTLGQPRMCQRSPGNRSTLLWEPLCQPLPKVQTISYAQLSPSWHVIVEAY